MEAADFEAVYRQQYSLVLSLATHRLSDPTQAEDATSEVFRLAWEHYQDGGSVTLPWLYQTLRNVVANQYRRAQRTTQVQQLLSATQTPEHLPDEEIHDAFIIQAAMAELRDADRELLMMAYWDDLSRAEIAQVLGCTSVAVRVRLTRAKKRLSNKLDIGTQKKGGRDD